MEISEWWACLVVYFLGSVAKASAAGDADAPSTPRLGILRQHDICWFNQFCISILINVAASPRRTAAPWATTRPTCCAPRATPSCSSAWGTTRTSARSAARFELFPLCIVNTKQCFEKFHKVGRNCFSLSGPSGLWSGVHIRVLHSIIAHQSISISRATAVAASRGRRSTPRPSSRCADDDWERTLRSVLLNLLILYFTVL